MAENIIFTEGSGLADSVFGKSYEPIKMLIEKKAEAFEQHSFIDDIYVRETSTHFAEKITSMTAMDGPSPVDEGGTYPIVGYAEGFSKTVEHVEWKNSFSITQKAMEDAKNLNLRTQPTAFVNGWKRVKETFGTQLLTGATASSIAFKGKKFDTTSSDGSALFAKDHPSKTSTKLKQSNLFSNGFSVDNLALIETQMQNAKDDEGNVLNVIPDTILIPNIASLKQSVFEAIGADKDPETSNNGMNYLFGRWTVIVNPYWIVSGADKPFIVFSSGYNRDNIGAVWYDRTPLVIKSYVDETTDNNIWKGRQRFGAGFNDWRAFAMGGVSGGTELA
ncbi:MAG: hypothetical protein PUA50_07935 [Eubacteriales bacterium]|nr:hypothetical protein [Eubacteriales bacterium]